MIRPWRALRRTHVVLEIWPTAFRAVGRRGTETLWELGAERRSDESLAVALRAFVARFPRARATLVAPAVHVSVGPDIARIKHLRGVPDVQEVRLLTALVREGVSRFFVGEANAWLTSDVVRRDTGELWVAAFERTAVEAIGEAVRDSGLSLVGVVAEADPALGAPLRLSRGEPVSGRRGTIAALAATAAVIVALLAPGLSATRTAAQARAELIAVREPGRQALGETATLTQLRGVLDEYARLATQRRSTLEFVAQLTTALPARTALMMVRIDSLGGAVVAVGPNVTAVVSRLDSIPGVEAPEIVGPVTREVIDGAELERATVRFVFRREEAP